MSTTVVDWEKVFEATLPGILGLLGGYFGSYLAAKGKDRAEWENRSFRLAREFAEAAAQEQGKRLATHADIENVLAEVRSVTRETETIKAQIGSDLWLRQAAWNEKKELFYKLIKNANVLNDRMTHLVSVRMTSRGNSSDVTESSRTLFAAQTQFLDSLHEAEVFLDGIEDLRTQFINIPGLADLYNPGTGPQGLHAAVDAFYPIIRALVAKAKHDLGVKD